ncbi:MAG: hypothetical protein ACYCVH_03100 [Ignavibacteriaceae bacterium]
MGQQQLLLIVLGVIIVGIAIVVGINLFNANAVSSNRDAVIADLNNLAAQAHQYYIRPTSMGGGGNSFTGWDITKTGLTSTPNGTYTASIAPAQVTITGVGVQKVNATNYVTAVMYVNSPGTDSVKVTY